MTNCGKMISQADDSSKLFQMKCLSYGKTLEEKSGKGIDVETLYYSKEMDLDGNILSQNNKYYAFEYLKDECPYTKSSVINPLNGDEFPEEDKVPNYFSPWKSDPNRYPKNWRKFHALLCLAKRLEGELILVNYSDGFLVDNIKGKIQAPKGFDNQVRVMVVNSVDKDIALKNIQNSEKNDYITYKETKCMTLEQYAKRLIKMNQNCSLPNLTN